MQEKNNDVIFTPESNDEMGRIDEFPILPEVKKVNSKTLVEEIEDEIQEELKSEVDETSDEPKELTEEEKHELFIKQLKESKIKFRPIKHIGNITINKFGTAFKKERKRKNKQAKASRRANRK